MNSVVSAGLWAAILLIGLILLVLAYYVLLTTAKAVIILAPVIISLTGGALLGGLVGGVTGGAIFAASIILGIGWHQIWEGSALYQKIEEYFERKTDINNNNPL